MLNEYPDGRLGLYYKSRQLQFKQLYDRVQQPIEQGRVIPNERIVSGLEFIKANQNQREKKRRSTRFMRKRHLEILPSPITQHPKVIKKGSTYHCHEISKLLLKFIGSF